MNFLKSLAALGAIILWPTNAVAMTINAEATFFNFFNQGTVMNNSAAPVSITGIIFTLGLPEPGIGTWDIRPVTGGTYSDLLGGGFAQTINFNGLSIGSGSSFAWSNLDFDIITSVDPLAFGSGPVCTSSGCEVETALDNALFTLIFSNGDQLSSGFSNGNIFLTHHLEFESPRPAVIPLPAALPLYGTGLAIMGFIGWRRKRKMG